MEKDNMSMKGLPKLGTGKEFTGLTIYRLRSHTERIN